MELREIESATKEIIEVVVDCIKNKKRLPTLILVYTGIDMLAALTREKTDDDTSGNVFKDWVDKYLLPELGRDIDSADVWAARCGVLHTNQPDSRLSRSGKARLLEYVQGPQDFIDHCQKEIDPNKDKRIFLNLEDLSEAFIAATIAFFSDANQDPQLMDRVKFHGSKIFARDSFPTPKKE